LRYIVILMAFYLHLGPFAQKVIATIDARLAELEPAGTEADPDFVADRVALALQQ
jgi:hypothetical protein